MGTSIQYIIAVDPGKMTGWARTIDGSFMSGQTTLEGFLHWMHMAIIDTGLQPKIICEDFIYTSQTAKKSRQTWSTEGIGVLRFLAMEYGCEFTLQSPSEAKAFASNDKLKAIGWHVPGKIHANDAARHLLVYSVKNQLVSPKDLM